jgi:hypothetical protein
MAKIVQFTDGTFGVRRMSFFGYEYLDLTSPRFWWQRGSTFMDDCRGSEELARRAYSIVYDKGTPIKGEPL